MNFENTDPTDPPSTDVGAHDCTARFGTQPRAARRGRRRALRPGRARPAAAVARGDRGDLRRLQRQPDQPRGAPVQLPEALGLQPVRRSHRSAQRRERGRHCASSSPRSSSPTTRRSTASCSCRRASRRPGTRAAQSAPNATLELPGWHGDREDVRVPERRRRGGRRDAPVDPPREDRRRLVLGGDGVHLGEGRRATHRCAPRDRGRHRRRHAGTTRIPTPTSPRPTPAAPTSYLIPNANQCGTCHVNDDKDPGDSPIGTKVRLLNRPMDYGSGPRTSSSTGSTRACSRARPRSRWTRTRSRPTCSACRASTCPATPRTSRRRSRAGSRR